MNKKTFAIIMSIFFTATFFAQTAAAFVTEELLPGNTIVSIDAQLTGKIKSYTDPLLQGMLDDSGGSGQQDAKTALLINKLLNGEKVSFSLVDLDSFLVSFNVTSEEWASLLTGSERLPYDNSREIIRFDGNNYASKIENLVVIGSTLPSVQRALDFANGTSVPSLAANAGFQSMLSSYSSPRLFGLTANIGALSSIIAVEPGLRQEGQLQDLFNLLDLLDFYGGSVADTPTGYGFNFKLKANSGMLAQRNISLNPGGSFTPNLFNRLPNAKILMYSESFNASAETSQMNSIINNSDIYDELEQETGFDLDSFMGMLNKEAAFAVQYDQNSVLPYASFIANVVDHRAEAETKLTELSNSIMSALRQNRVPRLAYLLDDRGQFKKFTFDITKLDDYNGPQFDPLVITFGITDDNILIISNYPDIENPVRRTGVSADADFMAHPELRDAGVKGISFLNARNVWSYVDSLLSSIENSTATALPLDFYESYYGFLNNIYTWKDLAVVTRSTNDETAVSGKITVDDATHQTYRQFLEETRARDTDLDGMNDFEERFWSMPVSQQDSDGDGVSDIDEITRAMDPDGEGNLFPDVGENAYYSDEVAFLNRRGAINGYNDGFFRPESHVTRAEFITMVMKAFDQDSNLLDLSRSYRFSIFSDVDANSWYGPNVTKASSLGFVSGSMDSEGRFVFRPGDRITRAEALAILNHASKKLRRTFPSASCGNSPFADVSANDWFCMAVINGYEEGITRGRSTSLFKPFDALNRAEAAVMIKRALEKDLEFILDETDSAGQGLGDFDFLLQAL